ncbi:DUF2577 domain-containing protein [Paenibacillus vini]|uniref:DUF2577 domain-containing protein n=1 Tax=Paenibacillus vini TaxID=1476024 RepID=UPI0025B6BA1D|nr:DUF2577 domain-containing protein [Paenibacillus vini]MDN4069711.1 DUF2577 domain-containing protein [Paenibacillus vini]
MLSDEYIGHSGAAKLRHVIKQLGYNKDVDVEFATILAPLPDIRVKLDGQSFELDADDLIVCEHLTEHKRQAEINGSIVEITFKDALKPGDRVVIVSYFAGQQYVILDRI